MAESVKVQDQDDGQRLDRWLKKYYPALAFGQMQKILRTGQVRVDGKRAKGETRLVAGQEVRIPPQLEAPAEGKDKALSPKEVAFIRSLIVYEDEHMIAINKPAGLAVQGGTKIVRHIDGLLEGLAEDGVRPHLVHRLDKDTSGVLLLARNPKIARALGDIFKGRDIRKYYWAVTVPVPEIEQGKVKTSLAKTQDEDGTGERVRSVAPEEGKMALTYYTVMESVGKKLAWVAFWPRTGRTHQIRVHAVEMGCALLGDFKYDPHQDFFDDKPELPKVLHLHARRLMFRHPVTGKQVDISAPLGAEMKKTFTYFGFNANDKSDPFAEVE